LCAFHPMLDFTGGIYSLRLTFANTYPAKPPKVRFVSEMYHPNGE